MPSQILSGPVELLIAAACLASEEGFEMTPSIPLLRCRSMLSDGSEIVKVVHVGDAPADILAAKSCVGKLGCNVGVIGVATGRYPASLLRELCGKPIPQAWEPVVLEEGLNDPAFLSVFAL